MDDYNVKLHNVDIYINDIKTSASECKGKFEVQAHVGDTIRFLKIGYVNFETILKRKRRFKINLSYTYENFEHLFTKKSKEREGIYSTSQPLYVINGIPADLIKNLKDMKQEYVKKVKVIKGQKAIDLFGYYASAGVVIVTKTCDFLPEIIINYKYHLN